MDSSRSGHLPTAHLLQALTSLWDKVVIYWPRSGVADSGLKTHVPEESGGSALEARLREAASPSLEADSLLPTAQRSALSDS